MILKIINKKTGAQQQIDQDSITYDVLLAAKKISGKGNITTKALRAEVVAHKSLYPKFWSPSKGTEDGSFDPMGRVTFGIQLLRTKSIIKRYPKLKTYRLEDGLSWDFFPERIEQPSLPMKTSQPKILKRQLKISMPNSTPPLKPIEVQHIQEEKASMSQLVKNLVRGAFENNELKEYSMTKERGETSIVLCFSDSVDS